MKKLISVFIISLILILIFGTTTYQVKAFGIKDLTGTPPTATETKEIEDLGNSVFSIIRTIGIVLSVAVLAILGIKYMLGSVEEKAEYKKTMIPYIIGAALVFMASTIATIIYKFAQNI